MVAFKGPNKILGLYKCNYSLTVKDLKLDSAFWRQLRGWCGPWWKWVWRPCSRIFFYWIERERKEGRRRKGERERERENSLPSMCSDWGSNPQPFGIHYDALTDWATLPGLKHFLDLISKQPYSFNFSPTSLVTLVFPLPSLLISECSSNHSLVPYYSLH